MDDDEEAGSRERISTPVIETLERGWSDWLPEHAYLASMRSQMECRLSLTTGMMKPVLPAAMDWRLQMTLSQHRNHLGKIDVFTGEEQYGFTGLIRLGQLVIKRMQLNHVQLKS